MKYEKAKVLLQSMAKANKAFPIKFKLYTILPVSIIIATNLAYEKYDLDFLEKFLSIEHQSLWAITISIWFSLWMKNKCKDFDMKSAERAWGKAAGTAAGISLAILIFSNF